MTTPQSDPRAGYITDTMIEDALSQHGDPDHPDAHTVDDIRELLAHVQHDAENVWDQWLDNIEHTHSLVIAQDDDVVVLDTGEHDTVRRALETYDGPVTVDDIAEHVASAVHHHAANEINPDYSWGVTYPRVVRLPRDATAGQRFVEATVNGLQRRGLAPGQAWAYYGVELQGESRNRWGARKGDHDHKNVSDALDKARAKLPEA
jgi:predicted NBD/HSP70 family sugar kinase